MADMFAPKAESTPTFERPVGPAAPAPSAIGAIAEFGANAVKAYEANEYNERRRNRGSGGDKRDESLGFFAKELEYIEAVRQKSPSQAALLERKLGINMASAGISIGDAEKNAYRTVTGRDMNKEWGLTDQEVQQDTLLSTAGGQAAYLTAQAKNPTADHPTLQALAYEDMAGTAARTSQLEALEIKVRIRQAFLSMDETQQKAAGMELADLTYKQVASIVEKDFFVLTAAFEKGLPVNRTDLREALLAVQKLEARYSRPVGVSEEQWKPITEQLKTTKAFVQGLLDRSSNEVVGADLGMTVALAVSKMPNLTTSKKMAVMQDALDKGKMAAQAMTGEASFLDAFESINQMDPELLNLFTSPSGIRERVKAAAANESSVPGQGDINSNYVKNNPDTPVVSGKQAFHMLEASRILSKNTSLDTPESMEQFGKYADIIARSLGSENNTDVLAPSFVLGKMGLKEYTDKLLEAYEKNPDSFNGTARYNKESLAKEAYKQSARALRLESDVDVLDVRFDQEKREYVLLTKPPVKLAGIEPMGMEKSKVKFFDEVSSRYGGSFNAAVSDRFRKMSEPARTFVTRGRLTRLEEASEHWKAFSSLSDSVRKLSVVEPPEGPSAPSSKRETSEVLSSLPATESLLSQTEASSYSTLYNNAEKTATDFKGVDVTSMTIGELKEFTKPSGPYGQYVKANLSDSSEAKRKGQTSTPLGKYQIVGTTLGDVAKKLNLPDDTMFTPEVQDRMFLELARARVFGKSDEQARAGLRAEWEGLKDVSDEELNKVVAEIKSYLTDNESNFANKIEGSLKG